MKQRLTFTDLYGCCSLLLQVLIEKLLPCFYQEILVDLFEAPPLQCSDGEVPPVLLLWLVQKKGMLLEVVWRMVLMVILKCISELYVHVNSVVWPVIHSHHIDHAWSSFVELLPWEVLILYDSVCFGVSHSGCWDLSMCTIGFWQHDKCFRLCYKYCHFGVTQTFVGEVV